VSISVVIPTLDRVQRLRHVLPTYLSQPETREIIVVVDGSRDGTLTYLTDLVRTESRIIYIDKGSIVGSHTQRMPVSRLQLQIISSSGKMTWKSLMDSSPFSLRTCRPPGLM